MVLLEARYLSVSSSAKLFSNGSYLVSITVAPHSRNYVASIPRRPRCWIPCCACAPVWNWLWSLWRLKTQGGDCSWVFRRVWWLHYLFLSSEFVHQARACSVSGNLCQSLEKGGSWAPYRAA